MKKKPNQLTKQEYIHTLDLLYTAASSLQERDTVKRFLRDLLTPSERVMLGRRIWIARLLLAKTPQDEICRKLKVGPNTVCRVGKWLEDQFPGYEKAIQNINKEMDKRAIMREIKDNPLGYAARKKKYPLYYLLFPEPKPKKKYLS